MRRPFTINPRWILRSAVIAAIAPVSAQAAIRNWANPLGGDYVVPNNWANSQVPGSNDAARFNNGGAYTLELNKPVRGSGGFSNGQLLLGNDRVVLQLGGLDYSATSTSATSLILGLRPEDVARATVRNGKLNTKAATLGQAAGSQANLTIARGVQWEQDGRLIVGGKGTAGLTVIAGAKVHSQLAVLGVTDGSAGNVLISGDKSQWNIDRGVKVGSDDAGAGSLTVRNGAAVTMEGALRIRGLGTLKVDGGTLTVGSIERALTGGIVSFLSGRIHVTKADVQLGDLAAIRKNGDRLLNLGPDTTLDINHDATLGPDTRLVLAGGNMSASHLTADGDVEFASDDSTLTAQTVIANAGLAGRGTLAGDLIVNGHADIAHQFTVQGTLDNLGTIAMAGGTLDVGGALLNGVGASMSGFGTVNAPSGMTNHGQVAFSGNADVNGNVNNAADGHIAVAGAGSTATFHGNVVHNGSASVGAGSTLVFAGGVSGAGNFTGPGLVHFEGSYSPGNSPASVHFDGPVAFGSSATLNVELGGTGNGEFDQIVSDTSVVLNDVHVVLAPGFDPQVGDAFAVVTAPIITYNGDITVPTLAGGKFFEVQKNDDSLMLVVQIPEVSSLSMLAMMAASSQLLRRRRRS